MMKRNEKKTENILQSRLAGTWYTSDVEDLRSEINGYLDQADVKPLDDVIALILPHAGYAYSGATAAYGIGQLKGRKFERVIVMGPSHSCAMRNMVSLPEATQYETPLGKIPLDTDFIAKLTERPFATRNPQAHLDEHSVQIELPMLQSVLNDFKLVPIVCGQLDISTIARLGAQLRSMIDDKTLVVASSDFTHFGPRFGYSPFKQDIPASIKRLDMGALSKVEQKNAKGFMEYVDKTGATICGRAPIGLLLAMLPEDADVHLLKYDTSGRMTGDYANTVSYVAAAVTGNWNDGKHPEETRKTERNSPAKAGLNDQDKDRLLKLAHATLADYMATGSKPSPEELGIEITKNMRQTMGAFVTLHENGQLRGCIGEIKPRLPLFEAVIDHAINAAVNDPRFRPVKPSELDKLHFEISALTPPHKIDSYDQIVLGKHGVVLHKGLRAAVFLPQVAPEQGWTLEETLTHLAVKAGLPPDGWRKGANFEVFEAIVFSED